MSMSRKDFEQIAEVLREFGMPDGARIELAEKLSKVFKNINPRFDSEKFMDAIRGIE